MMSVAVLKTLSMLWCFIFCGTAGMVTAAALALFQWLLFYFGLYSPESGRAFSPSFWTDFFTLSAGVGLILVLLLAREFWEDGITIDKPTE